MASAVRALIDPVGGRCSAIRARCCRAGRVRPIQLAEGAATHVTIKASAVPNAVTILAWDCLTVRARRQCAGSIGQGTAVEFSATNITTPALTYACSHDTTRWLWLAKLAWRRALSVFHLICSSRSSSMISPLGTAATIGSEAVPSSPISTNLVYWLAQAVWYPDDSVV